MKSPIPYIGGKRALLHEILPLIPDKYHKFIEVFGGGASVLFAKTPTRFEVYNDVQDNLVNLFLVFKERHFSFLHELKVLNLNSRTEFAILKKIASGDHSAYAYLEDELNIVKVTLEPLEYEEIKEILTTKASMYDVIRAVSYYRLLRTSYGAGGTSFGARPVEIYTHKVQRDISKAHQRLKRVVIENKDFEDLIKQYDAEDSFFYCDPPYFGTEKTYDAPFYSNDHERLYHVLSNIKGKFLLSYDDSHYIRNLYKDFYIISVKRLNNLKQRYDPGSEFKEILISNYDILKIKKEKTIQLELWSEENGI
ncbi:DNA adenine methylase [Erysipelothrix rhusiopathiae]|nr:DNA adenine methylase [Erysipelothrix rhusiopathiae]MDE9421746.1 DNA adenine methylase [Erysipelothrix rhusiopathiae]